MKFRVEREALADAVTWAARSLSTRPTMPVLGGLLLSVDRRPALDLRLRPRGIDGGRPRHQRRRRRPGARLRPPARRHHQGAAAAPGRRDRRGSRPVDHLRCGQVHPADDAGRGLSAAAEHADHGGHCPRRRVRARRRPGRHRRRPRRHAADAHRRPARDRRHAAHARRHRPVPPRRARAGLEPGGPERRARPGAGPGTHAQRRGEEPGRQRIADDRAVQGGGSGEGIIGFTGTSGGRASRATTRLLDATFPAYRSLLPNEWSSAAEITVAPLVEAVRRVALVADRSTPVRLEFADRHRSRCPPAARTRARAEEQLEISYDGRRASPPRSTRSSCSTASARSPPPRPGCCSRRRTSRSCCGRSGLVPRPASTPT